MNIINRILVSILIVFSVNLIVKYIRKDIPSIDVSEQMAIDFDCQNVAGKDWDYYQAVFEKKGDVEEDRDFAANSKHDHLSMALRGTVISSPDSSFAIIDNLVTGKQNLYRLGDEVQGMTITAMSRNQITLTKGEEKYVFAVNDSNGSQVVQKNKIAFNVPEPDSINDERTQSSALDCVRGNLSTKDLTSLVKDQLKVVDFSKLLTQMRIKPFFVNGKCIGFQLNNIRNSSLMQQIGLKNGDIILSINGKPMNDPLQAMQSLYDINPNASLHLGVERNNQQIEMDCYLES